MDLIYSCKISPTAYTDILMYPIPSLSYSKIRDYTGHVIPGDREVLEAILIACLPHQISGSKAYYQTSIFMPFAITNVNNVVKRTKSKYISLFISPVLHLGFCFMIFQSSHLN